MTVSSGNHHILRFEGVRKQFGGLVAVDGVSSSVRRGGITGLIGPNGAGKTTLFNVISGFLRPEAGRIHYGDTRIDGLRPHEIAGLGLVRTFQTARVFSRMSVIDNVLLGAPGHPGERFAATIWARRRLKAREKEANARAMELLTMVGLDRLRDDYAGTLSGGQRKLLEFARVLMAEPTAVLLDEPMAGINRSLARELLETLERAKTEHELTFLLIEHDLEVVMSTCDWIMVMDQGTIIAEGTPADVQADPRVIAAYLGTRAARRSDRSDRVDP